MEKQQFVKAIQQKSSDVLEDTIGNFGKWQLRISFLLALLKFPIAWFQLGIIFLAPPTEFWCKKPGENPENYAFKPLKNFMNETIDVCLMKDPNVTVPCPYGYEYDRTTFKNSIITEWDLVCGRQRLVDATQIVLMLGVLIGSILFGCAADRIGRKKTLIISIFFQSVCGVASSLSPTFWLFLLFRFLMAIANGGTVITSFVMCMELVGGIWRTVVPILYQIPYGFGNSLMAGVAYFFRGWREFQLVLSGLSGAFILYAWCVPESPRWLLAVGRKREAEEILKDAAVANGLNLGDVERRLEETYCVDRKEVKPANIFSTNTLRRRTFLLCLNWLACGTTFYAFGQYAGHIGSDIFLTVALSGFVVMPGAVLSIFVIDKCGRRCTIIVAHLLTSVCFLILLVVPIGSFPYDWPRLAATGLGIFGLSISMPSLYLFTGELYPTVVRNAGVGFSVMFSRIGSMLAPLLVSLDANWALSGLFGLALLEALLVLPLPETRGIKLPENLTDLEKKRTNNNSRIGDQKYYRVVDGSFRRRQDLMVEA